jgi:hypothetical protein
VLLKRNRIAEAVLIPENESLRVLGFLGRNEKKYYPF